MRFPPLGAPNLSLGANAAGLSRDGAANEDSHHRRSKSSVGVLDVLERHAGVVEARRERVAEAVGAELPGCLEAGVAREASHESPGL